RRTPATPPDHAPEPAHRRRPTPPELLGGTKCAGNGIGEAPSPWSCIKISGPRRLRSKRPSPAAALYRCEDRRPPRLLGPPDFQCSRRLLVPRHGRSSALPSELAGHTVVAPRMSAAE